MQPGLALWIEKTGKPGLRSGYVTTGSGAMRVAGLGLGQGEGLGSCLKGDGPPGLLVVHRVDGEGRLGEPALHQA